MKIDGKSPAQLEGAVCYICERTLSGAVGHPEHCKACKRAEIKKIKDNLANYVPETILTIG